MSPAPSPASPGLPPASRRTASPGLVVIEASLDDSAFAGQPDTLKTATFTALAADG